MPQHLDRLSVTDASFLHQEGPAAHMHIGGLTVFAGPPSGYEELLDHVRGRLHLVPRYRQRLAFPRFDAGRPLWVDDPHFELRYHLRHVALPRPGSEEQLQQLTARIFSTPLDRSKPLWELWVVEGLADDGFGLISKTHHSAIDGVSGVDLATVLLDLQPEGAEVPHSGVAWAPRPSPTTAEVLAAGVLGAARGVVDGLTRVAGTAARPGALVDEAREAAEGVGELVWAGLNPAPPTPLNVPIGPHRRYVGVRARLADVKLVKDELGGTVNDVVLAVVSGALRTWLLGRGVRCEGLELRALVPVSTRTPGERGAMGNRITAMRGPLPVYIEDPQARLHAVRAAMDGLKESKQAVGAEVLVSAQGWAPPTVLAQASRLQFSTRLFNLIVTNVPGPQFPLYVRGRRMEDVFPVAFLPRDHALAIAIMSYDGGLNLGLLADYDALPDVDVIADGIDLALEELVVLARARRRGRGRDGGAGPAAAGAGG